MKSVLYRGIYISLAATTLTFSCTTTKTATKNETQEIKTVIESTEKAEPSESDLYAQKVASAKISLISTPKEPIKGRIFTSPYTLQVLDSEEKAVEGFELSVIYPSGRENGSIAFAETAILTDSEGKATFLPPTPTCSFNSEISFFPRGNTGNEEIAKIASENTIKAPFRVQTDLKSAGGVIAIVDFNQNGKPITSNPVSSTNILMSLMKLGFSRIGNIDLTNQVISGNDAKTLEKAKALVGNNSSFLLFGTIKIDSYERNDEGSCYKLLAEIKCMNLKTGEITFTSEKTVSATDKSDWTALDNARKEIAKDIANEIKYGI
ncbi:MAG: hypothetical protein IJT42_05900 [Treponema sp.]|nr:hypothetical protein [Treponema sp.]